VGVHYLHIMERFRVVCSLVVIVVLLAACNSQTSGHHASPGKYDSDTCIALDSYVDSLSPGQQVDIDQLYDIFGFGLAAENYSLTIDAAALENAVKLKDTDGAETDITRMSRTCATMGIGPNSKS
jgi:hypothetical protein